jgi:uncharacterized protein (TIGR00251 family)
MSWFRWREASLELRLRVVPRAARTEFVGAMEDGTYKIRLVAPPVEGKANACLVEFLARSFGVPRTQVEVVGGSQSRRKTVLVREPRRSPLPEIQVGP